MKNILFFLLFIPFMAIGQTPREITLDYSIYVNGNHRVKDTLKTNVQRFSDLTIQKTAYSRDTIAKMINDSLNNLNITSSQTSEQIIDSISQTINMPVTHAINFSKINNQYNPYTLTANTVFTPDPIGALSGSAGNFTIQNISPNTYTATFSGFLYASNSITDAFDNTTNHYTTYLVGCGGQGAYKTYKVGIWDSGLIPGAPIQLSAPSSFQATAASQTQINLTWTLPSPNGSGFQIYDSLAGGSWALLTSPIKTATSYSHTGLTNGQHWYYRGITVGNGSDTLTSTYATTNATTSNLITLATPTLRALTVISSTAINAVCSLIANNSGYNWTISRNGGSTYTDLATTTTNDTTYSITGLHADSTYYIKVRANGNLTTYNHSAYSTAQYATTQSANSAPVASSVNITGSITTGNTLTGHYTYSDADGNTEGTSTFRWLTSVTDGGAQTAIGGATSSTLVITSELLNNYLYFEVTPVASTGISPGTAVQSSSLLLALEYPLTVGNLWAWYSADNVTSASDGTNLRVISYNDKSGNNNAISGTITNTNDTAYWISKSKLVIRNNHLQTSTVDNKGFYRRTSMSKAFSEITIFADYEFVRDRGYLLNLFGYGSTIQLGINTSGYIRGLVYINQVYSAYTLNQHNIVTIRCKNGTNNFDIYINKVKVLTGTTNALPVTATSMSLFSIDGETYTSQYNGYNQEILIFDKYFTDQEISDMQDYLKTKVGL
jgi:hypothetical protein